MSSLAPASEVRHVVVFLADAPKSAVTPIRTDIRQIDETFVPRTRAVTVGSDVGFPNDDPFYHNVFSLSRAKTFDLGRYPSGQTRSVRFERPGLVKVFCQIHSHMSASVMVFDHPWFAVPDSSGSFEIVGVPLGRWRLTAWHERLGETVVDLRVDGTEGRNVNFILPVPKN